MGSPRKGGGLGLRPANGSSALAALWDRKDLPTTGSVGPLRRLTTLISCLKITRNRRRCQAPIWGIPISPLANPANYTSPLVRLHMTERDDPRRNSAAADLAHKDIML